MLPNERGEALLSEESHGSSPDRIAVLIAAFMATLIMSAKLNDIDPQAWLAEVLANMADMPTSRLEQLLPWNWSSTKVNAQGGLN